MKLVLATLLLAMCGCTALSPPPILPRHASTLPMPEGAVALSAVVGFGMSGFLQVATGVELRAAWQASPDTELGIGIGIGVAELGVGEPIDPNEPRSRPLRNVYGGSVRAYASIVPFETDRVAFAAGVGLVALTTGLVSFTLDGSATIAYTNDTFVPYASGFIALSKPLRHGETFGDHFPPPTSIYVGPLVGMGVPIGGHFISLEGGIAKDLRSSEITVGSLTLGERWQSR